MMFACLQGSYIPNRPLCLGPPCYSFSPSDLATLFEPHGRIADGMYRYEQLCRLAISMLLALQTFAEDVKANSGYATPN